MFKWLKRKFSITPSGECLLRYCKLISNKQWTEKDYIEAYESDIKNLCDQLKEDDHEFSREEMAELVVLTFKEILPEVVQ